MKMKMLQQFLTGKSALREHLGERKMLRVSWNWENI